MSTQNTTLELFAFTKPTSQFPAGMTQTKVADNGSVSVTLSLEKRKVLAERLGLKGKDNAGALNRAILQLTDQVKAAAAGEFMKLAASEDWTGRALHHAPRQKRNAEGNLVPRVGQTPE